MNLSLELGRITEPAPVKSDVRFLCPAEIDALWAAGEITYIKQIPSERLPGMERTASGKFRFHGGGTL